MKKTIISIALAVLVATGTAQNAYAVSAGSPILITQGNVETTLNGVTYSVRKDYNHPYVKYTSAYGDQYDRQLVVEVTFTNQSGAPIGYQAYMAATDANGKELVNADPQAPLRVGILENGASASVMQFYLLTKENDVSTFTLSYPATAVSLTVDNPVQKPGVGGANRKSAIRGSVTSGAAATTTTSK